jgi:hypothetical protein
VWISIPPTAAPRTGIVTLIAMRARSGPNEPAQAPETSRWLDAIRRQLLPRMPLAARLAVVAPTYVPFTLTATIECVRGLAPNDLKAAVEKTLSERLTLVASSVSAKQRDPGIGVTIRDLTVWIRSTAGVARVTSLKLFDETGKALPNGVAVPPDGFPKWLFDPNSISVSRQASGGTR